MSLPTLQDFARREGADKKIQKIVELIEPHNEFLWDIPWYKCNMGSMHKTTVRTGIPEATWRLLNYGVPNVLSTTRQVVDTTGLLENYGEVDKVLADLNDNTPEWRASEDKAVLLGFGETLASSFIYGDQSVDPEKITGLAPRFNTPSTDDSQSGYNIIDGGAADGQTDCLSIWLVGWGPDTVHGLYADGLPIGWSQRDLGEQTKLDANGGQFQIYRTHYQWQAGLSVRNWKYVSRVCNIDSSALTRDAATGAKLVDLMIQAAERVQDLSGASFTFYVPRKIRAYLRHHILARVASNLSFETVAGRRVMVFDDIPVRRTDALVSETAITDATGSFADL